MTEQEKRSPTDESEELRINFGDERDPEVREEARKKLRKFLTDNQITERADETDKWMSEKFGLATELKNAIGDQPAPILTEIFERLAKVHTGMAKEICRKNIDELKSMPPEITSVLAKIFEDDEPNPFSE